MKKGIFILTLCILAFTPVLRAQQYFFKHYNVENGLSNNSVSSSLQDKFGFLWFGTRNGLNRFDGYSFRIFKQIPGDSNSIGSNFINCLYEDKQSRLWVGTNKGIYIYNDHTEQFSAVPAFANGEITLIKEDKLGRLWVISTNNLYCIHVENGSVTPYVVDEVPNSVATVGIGLDGSIWASTNTGLLKKYKPAIDNFETVATLKGADDAHPEAIKSIYPLGDYGLLIGTLTQGIKRFIPAGNQFQDIISANPDKTGIYVREIVEMNKSEYWIATETGIYIFDPVENTTTRLKKEYDNPYSVSDNVILSFCKDREGGLWVGTYFGGLNYYPKPFTPFEKYFPEYSKPSISGNAIHEICQDHLGNLWVGTEDGGLNKINLEQHRFTSFMPTGEKTSISYHNIHGLVASGDTLWVGTFMHGLDLMNIRTGNVIRHYNAGNGTNDLKSDFIVSLYRTRSGQILVGTWSGMFRYNPVSDNFSAVPYFDYLIQAMWEDETGTLWACTLGNGVLFYNPRTGERGSLLYDARQPNSLNNNHVNGMYEDSRRNFWFATEGGLCRYEKDKKRFTRYTTQNGFPDNLVFRILEDEKHNLFVSTSSGLVCLDPANGNIKTYTQSNGLLSDQFNYNSAFKTADGQMFFGSVKGLIGFNPGEFTKNTRVPPVYITGMEVNNHALAIDSKKTGQNESLLYRKTISLPYDQSTLSIDFAALSFTVPEMNEYLYKMEGLDKDWTLLKKNRKVYYTKLAPGSYTFKVKGANSSGEWNPRETSIEIIISPPFWQSSWAYLFYAVFIAGVACLLVIQYHHRQTEKNQRRFETFEMEKEREIYLSKIEFFTNIAHEIRTPLTLIKLPLDKLTKKLQGNPEMDLNLRTMEKNTTRLIDLTNQLLDFRRTEMDKFSLNFVKTNVSDLIEETYRSFQLAAEQKDILFTMELPALALHAYVDPEAVKKIFSNLFNNAIKYAESKVCVRLHDFSSRDKLFTVEIRNDGFSIPAELKDKIFEPFYRIKDTEKQPGNGIGLPLSRSLAELHKGSLAFSIGQEGFNTFILSLPIHQEKEFRLAADPVENVPAPETTDSAAVKNPDRPEILIVEDNKDILDFVSNEVAQTYFVRRAGNGAEALELLKEGNVQLVISDIMMPVMDGIRFCRHVKTNIEYSHIPVILLTAKNSLHDKIEGLEVGADAYIEKPFDIDHLGAQISNLLTNRNKIKEHFANSPLAHIKTIGYTREDKTFLERLQAVIDENLLNPEIDVEQLAKKMNMSRPTFYRKIKALSNLTPHELIHVTRLKKAAELLAQGSYKVYEVADMVGYTLQTNFSRDFHKQFGMTPSDYMADSLEKRNVMN